MLNAEILSVSNKLLSPFFPDTYSLWLTEKLNNLGVDVKQKIIVNEKKDFFEETLKAALNRSQIIIVLIDINHYVVIKGVISALLANLHSMMEESLPFSNSEIGENGSLFSTSDKHIIVLPNDLSEIKSMFSLALTSLKSFAPPIHLKRRILKVVGLSESAIDSQIAPIYSQYQGLTTMILFFQNEVHIRLAMIANSDSEAEEVLEEVVGKIATQLGKNLFAQNGEMLEDVIALGLTRKNYTVAITDNATGGLVTMRLTNSFVAESCLLRGDIRFYSPGKAIELINNCGELTSISDPVSQEGAVALAIDIQKRTSATIGLSITGIVDKGMSTNHHPVGLMFVALADESKVAVQRLQLPARDREVFRGLTSAIALDLLRRKYCF